MQSYGARPGGGGGSWGSGRKGLAVGSGVLEGRLGVSTWNEDGVTVGGGSWSGSWGLAGAQARRTVGVGQPWGWQVAPGPEQLWRVV